MGDEPKSAENTPDLIPQKHGGALYSGGKPGNKGGGRPKSVVRALAREEGYKSLVRLAKRAEAEEMSMADAIRLADLQLKYGIGTQSEVGGSEDAPPLRTDVHVIDVTQVKDLAELEALKGLALEQEAKED